MMTSVAVKWDCDGGLLQLLDLILDLKTISTNVCPAPRNTNTMKKGKCMNALSGERKQN